ncbi:MAG: (2Fe-2S)-binding protein [Deltaproteobacteria bacterium]|nr:(2Fe-2S)-binding protein [Deltaproteobacteria bacterium]
MAAENGAKNVTMTVNGLTYALELEGWERLLDVLRERLGLTGTKRGCDDATCGACTVVVDGEAKKSCVLPPHRFAGRAVLTIEAMARGNALHPIQQALIAAGAVQCGYCIPGIVMELYALFTALPEATPEQITEALAGHFCRCTGYEPILAGALVAQQQLRKGG